VTAAQALSRPDFSLDDARAGGLTVDLDPAALAIDESTLVAEFRYRGYLKRHDAQWRRALEQEARPIPAGFEYRGIPGLSREVTERLSSIRPDTLGHAARVPGVTPAAIAIVAARLAAARPT
jgi:tRNA uridine 5-carboxymethylaminomethyl modification enzyme